MKDLVVDLLYRSDEFVGLLLRRGERAAITFVRLLSQQQVSLAFRTQKGAHVRSQLRWILTSPAATLKAFALEQLLLPGGRSHERRAVGDGHLFSLFDVAFRNDVKVLGLVEHDPCVGETTVVDH